MKKTAVIVAAHDPALRRHVRALLRARGCGVFEVLDSIDILRYAQRQPACWKVSSSATKRGLSRERIP